jgi:hypothetical protein
MSRFRHLQRGGLELRRLNQQGWRGARIGRQGAFSDIFSVPFRKYVFNW